MKKRIKIGVSLIILLIASFITTNQNQAKAAYNDNPNALYYYLADQAYEVDGTSFAQTNIQKVFKSQYGSKFKVIDTLDVNNRPYSTASESPNKSVNNKGFKPTGLQALTVVSETSKKLYIAFAGTKILDPNDANTSLVIMKEKTPGQLYQAQLYLNYIYNTYPQYRDYKWYFTGHSLGGYLATKLFLDIRAGNWLNDSKSYKFGGPVKKTTISGVYTFNALAIPKFQVPTVQWNANKNGVYDKDIKNLYIKNEWLNSIYNMHKSEMAYFGSEGAINTGLISYTSTKYKKSSSISSNLSGYYAYSFTLHHSVTKSHGLDIIGKFVSK